MMSVKLLDDESLFGFWKKEESNKLILCKNNETCLIDN